MQWRFFGPVHHQTLALAAGLGGVPQRLLDRAGPPVLDLDLLRPLRRRPPGPPAGRMPLVTAVIARAA